MLSFLLQFNFSQPLAFVDVKITGLSLSVTEIPKQSETNSVMRVGVSFILFLHSYEDNRQSFFIRSNVLLHHYCRYIEQRENNKRRLANQFHNGRS